MGVGDQAGIGSRAIGEVEADQGGWRAGVAGRSGAVDLDLEHRAVIIPPAARYAAARFTASRAEQVAAGVGDQAGKGIRAIGAIEADQGGRRAGVAGRGGAVDLDLEHRAEPCRK